MTTHRVRRLSFFAASALVAVIAAGMLFVFVWPTEGTRRDDGLRPQSLLPAAEVEIGDVRAFALSDRVREVDPDGGLFRVAADAAIYLVRTENGELVAFDAHSTHRGCLVNWTDFRSTRMLSPGFYFNDPCSGATWTLEGSLLFGPAPRGLDRVHLEVRGGLVVVDPSRIESGESPADQRFGSAPPPTRTAPPTDD